MSENEIERMTDRAADAAVAVEMMGFELAVAPSGIAYGFKGNPDVPHYSTDDNATRLMRNRIAELGLQCEFAKILDADNFSNHSNPYGVKFDFLQATPRQQVNAALRAVRERGGKRE